MCLDMTLSLSSLESRPVWRVEVKASFVQGVGAFCLERALNSEGFPAFAAHIINKLLRARASPSTLDGRGPCRTACATSVIANAIDFNCAFVLCVPCDVPARRGASEARRHFSARAARGAFFDELMTYLDR